MTVTLEPLRDEDSDVLYRWINDRELVELSSVFAPVARADHDAWFEDVRRARGTFAIREDGRLVGSCLLIEDRGAPGEAELRIRIGERDARDRGLGSQALVMLLARGFENFGLQRIHLQVFTTNRRAIRAYEKVGFERASGAEAPSIAMSLRRSQFSRGAGTTEPSSSER